MHVGTYEVSAQKEGFQQMVQTGVVLSVGSRPILDFKMRVGRSEQVIQVEGEASRVDTETSSVGQLISPNQMANLPSNGRNFTDLLTWHQVWRRCLRAVAAAASRPPSTVHKLTTPFPVRARWDCPTCWMIPTSAMRWTMARASA